MLLLWVVARVLPCGWQGVLDGCQGPSQKSNSSPHVSIFGSLKTIWISPLMQIYRILIFSHVIIYQAKFSPCLHLKQIIAGIVHDSLVHVIAMKNIKMNKKLIKSKLADALNLYVYTFPKHHTATRLNSRTVYI